MNYFVLKINKADYLVVSETEWLEFLKLKKSVSKEVKKEYKYTLGNREFTYKEIKKIKNMFSGTYISIYQVMPEVAVKYGDYKELTTEILKVINDVYAKKIDYIDYFSDYLIKGIINDKDYDYTFEANAKHDFLKFFDKDDISKISNYNYNNLVKVALSARNDEDSEALSRILMDNRFAIPKDFDCKYSDAIEFDEKLKYIKDTDIIKQFLSENESGLNRLFSRENVYSSEMIDVINKINPLVYQISPSIDKRFFNDISKDIKPDEKIIVGSLFADNIATLLALKFKQTGDNFLKKVDLEPMDLLSEFKIFSDEVVGGMSRVPEIYNVRLLKTMLDVYGEYTKHIICHEIGVDGINSILNNIKNIKYDEKLNEELLATWVENWSENFKYVVKYITDDNKDFIIKYLSDEEKELFK